MTTARTARIRCLILPGLLAAACIVAPLAAASSPAGEAPERPAPAEVGVSGTKIAVDPETGDVVSTEAGESRALSEALEHALSRSAGGLEVFELPAGGLGVHLEGRFQHVMMVKVRADGSFELECVDSVRKAEKVLHPKAAESRRPTRVR